MKKGAVGSGRMAEQSSVGRKRVLGDGVGGCGRMYDRVR